MAARPPPPPIDSVYGIETAGVISASHLRSGSTSDAWNFGYAGSQPSIIRRVIEILTPEPRGWTFVDIGCGKGRALVVASEYAFDRIVGVELSPALSTIARANAAVIAGNHPDRRAIQVENTDAITFELPPGPLVVYLYNSLHAGLLWRLTERLAKHTAPMFLVYYNPCAGFVFDRCSAFGRYYAARLNWEANEIPSSDFGNAHDSVVVWKNAAVDNPPIPGADAEIRTVAGGRVGEVGH